MRCSKDLRKRVIDFVNAGGSKAEAARRFQVGRASVYRWLSPGGLDHKPPGLPPDQGRKLDWDVLRQHVKDYPDLTIKERATAFGRSRNAIWHALHKMKLTRKKKHRL
jgi:transposase